MVEPVVTQIQDILLVLVQFSSLFVLYLQLSWYVKYYFKLSLCPGAIFVLSGARKLFDL